jgi:hypothetical protein
LAWDQYFQVWSGAQNFEKFLRVVKEEVLTGRITPNLPYSFEKHRPYRKVFENFMIDKSVAGQELTLLREILAHDQ